MRCNISGVVAFAREEFPDDGAEGEAAHRLCDAVEAYQDLARRLRDLLKRYGPRYMHGAKDGYAEAMAAADEMLGVNR